MFTIEIIDAANKRVSWISQHTPNFLSKVNQNKYFN